MSSRSRVFGTRVQAASAIGVEAGEQEAFQGRAVVDVLGPDARLHAEQVRALGGRPAGGRVERLDVGERRVAGPARARLVPRPASGHVEVVRARPGRRRRRDRRRRGAARTPPTSTRRRSRHPEPSAPAPSSHTPTCRPVTCRTSADDLAQERACRSIDRRRGHARPPSSGRRATPTTRRRAPRRRRGAATATGTRRRRLAEHGLEERPRRGDARVEHVVDEVLDADGRRSCRRDRRAPGSAASAAKQWPGRSTSGTITMPAAAARSCQRAMSARV